MFYGWEEFKGGVSEPLVGNAMESATDLHNHVEVWSRDATITHLQRQLESTTAALQSEREKHAETLARNRELERELLRERTLVKQLDDEHKNHESVRAWYENEVQRLVRALEALEDAEERLVAQLGDLEAESLEQNRHFNAEINSLSLSLSQKEQELAFARTEIDSMRQRQVSLKQLEAMDLAAELQKSSRECDRMKLQSEALQEEVERVKSEASNLQQELALAKLMKTIQEERSVPSQLCRSESARLVMQRRTRHAALAV